jgi:uncharacterized alkaline shock family protein YloU
MAQEKEKNSDKMKNDKYTVHDIERAPAEDVTRISDEALLAYASQALSEVEGIVVSRTGIVGGLLGKKSPGKAIKISSSDQDVVIDVTLELEYGVKIPEVAGMIQTKIRHNIEEYTGKFVKAVNINIEAIRMPVEEKSLAVKKPTGDDPANMSNHQEDNL